MSIKSLTQSKFPPSINPSLANFMAVVNREVQVELGFGQGQVRYGGEVDQFESGRGQREVEGIPARLVIGIVEALYSSWFNAYSPRGVTDHLSNLAYTPASSWHRKASARTRVP